jgi:hypothetical protein
VSGSPCHRDALDLHRRLPGPQLPLYGRGPVQQREVHPLVSRCSNAAAVCTPRVAECWHGLPSVSTACATVQQGTCCLYCWTGIAAEPALPAHSAWQNDNQYCAVAYRPYQYTYFFGNRATQMYGSSSTYYDKAASEGPWGWAPVACGNGNIYICKIRANDYPCNPPPAPMPPPPSPPSPPIPPMKASCECRRTIPRGANLTACNGPCRGQLLTHYHATLHPARRARRQQHLLLRVALPGQGHPAQVLLVVHHGRHFFQRQHRVPEVWRRAGAVREVRPDWGRIVDMPTCMHYSP